jgi:hypothetical protein
MIASLLEDMRSQQWAVNGVRLKRTVDLLRLDEYGLLNSRHSSRELTARVKKLRDRILPRRALVITPQALKDGISEEGFFELGLQRRKINGWEKELAQKAGCDAVFIDFPPRPRVEKVGEQSMVKFSKERTEPLSKLCPTSGWIKGYSEVRRRAYVLAPPGYELKVAELALERFAEEGIKLARELCLELAKRT